MNPTAARSIRADFAHLRASRTPARPHPTPDIVHRCTAGKLRAERAAHPIGPALAPATTTARNTATNGRLAMPSFRPLSTSRARLYPQRHR